MLLQVMESTWCVLLLEHTIARPNCSVLESWQALFFQSCFDRSFLWSLSWVSGAIAFILRETIYLFKSCLAALALRLLLPGYLPSSLFATSVRMTEHFSLACSSRLYTSANNRRTSARSVKLSTPSEQRVALRRGRRRYCHKARPPPLWCLSNSLLPTMCISTRFKSFGIIYITIIRESNRSLPEDISHYHWPSRKANTTCPLPPQPGA